LSRRCLHRHARPSTIATSSGVPSDRSGVQVRQIFGGPGERWGAESGTDPLAVVIMK